MVSASIITLKYDRNCHSTKILTGFFKFFAMVKFSGEFNGNK